MRKYGTGEIIPESDDDQKTAAKQWSEKDDHELAEELADDGD